MAADYSPIYGWRECSICRIAIGSDGCTHTARVDGRVAMSEAAHERLVAELCRLRNLEAEIEDGRQPGHQ